MSFADHFSTAAAGYARFRPTYPAPFLRAVASLAPARRRAWDCATGSGQAAVGLAGEIDLVVATDASAAQIASATPAPRVAYAVALAETSCLAGGSMDLVTVAQALHWFDRPLFYREARRVLVPEGILAVWSYGLPRATPAVDALLQEFYTQTVGPYWPRERRMVDDEYRTVDFPFDEVPFAAGSMEAQWTLGDLAGYLETWSATLRYARERGGSPVPAVVSALRPLWGERETRPIRWPLFGRIGRCG